MKLTKKYISTHTPRQIAEHADPGEIDYYVSCISPLLDDVDLFGDTSPTDPMITDTIMSISNAQNLVSEWWEREIEEGKPHPTAAQLRFAYQILTAQAIRWEIDNPDGDCWLPEYVITID